MSVRTSVALDNCYDTGRVDSLSDVRCIDNIQESGLAKPFVSMLFWLGEGSVGIPGHHYLSYRSNTQ
jgi:hypothetical protein